MIPSKKVDPVCVHWLRVSIPPRGPVFLTTYAVGIVLSWIVAYLAVCIPALFVFGLENDAPGWLYGVFVSFAFVGPILWGTLFPRVRHRRWLRRSPERVLRLERIARANDTFSRVPHRHLECLLLQPHWTHKQVAKILTNCGPGHLFVAEDKAEPRYERPIAQVFEFEPIDIMRDEKDMVQIVAMHTGEDPADKKRVLEIQKGDKRRTRRIGDAIVRFCFYLLVVNGLVSFIRAPSMTWITVFFAIVVTGLLWRLWGGRRWWIVPGGLVYREDFFWRRKLRVQLLTLKDASLFVDFRSQTGTIVDRTRTLRFHADAYALWVVMAGWISQARIPTEEEVASLFQTD